MGVGQKVSDWWMKIMFLGEFERAVGSGIKSRFSITGVSTRFFCDSLYSLNIMLCSRFTYAVYISFLLMAKSYSIVWVYYLLIHLSISRRNFKK